MTPDETTRLLAFLDDLKTALGDMVGVLEALRADLKRREARDLEQQGRIPPGSSARAGGATPAPSGGDPRRGSQEVKFGRDKGRPIGLVDDLGWYRTALIGSIAAPDKAQYRGRNLDDLAAVDAEIARRSGGQGPASGSGEAPPDFGPGDDDIPFLHCGGIR